MRALANSAIFFTLLLTMVSGCAPAEAGTGTIEVRVTDAPPEYEVSSIMVAVSEVQVSRQAAASGVAWLSLGLAPTDTFDLLQIAGREELLASAEVGVGSYNQIRVIIDRLDVTLGDESGMVIVPEEPFDFIQPFEVSADETTIILIDFDVDKTVTVTDGEITIKPISGITLKIWQEEAD